MCQMSLELYNGLGHENTKVNGVEQQGCGMLQSTWVKHSLMEIDFMKIQYSNRNLIQILNA